MAPSDDDDTRSPWARPLLVGLGALLAVSLLVGGVVGVIAVGAAKLTGFEGASGGPEEEPSLYIPTGEPTTSPEAYPAPSDVEQPSPSPSESSTLTEEPSPSRPVQAITLQGYPNEVSGGERINLTGVYPAGEGATLQVQRFEGGWNDFPVTASVSGGIYSTYVMSGRTGVQRFRMIDKATGKASNPVRITIR